MQYICLNGEDIPADAKRIEEAMKQDNNVVFVYLRKKMPLHVYIGLLAEEGKLPRPNQFKLRICYGRNNLNLLFYRKNSGGSAKPISSMTQLIEVLNPGEECKIVVTDNKRSTLAEVVQQLIYIGYPLTRVEIMLAKEEKDHERAVRFMSRIDELSKRLNAAMESLGKIKINTFSREYEKKCEILNDVKASCTEISSQISKARNRQMKIAIAASKKTGKSIIVNSMVGEELAPTSLELATPNICTYKKSPDSSYHLGYNGRQMKYDTAEEIRGEIDREFKKAQENTGFGLADMEISYVSAKNNFEAYTVFDTPGPDAARADSHKEKAKKAMDESDVVVFAIDYAKYLTDTEESYLKEIKEQFNQQGKFDSLIFTINKIDQRYNDPKTTKSVTKSIDFIRERLRKIDSCYSDCAIFATSALQYFDAVEAEKVCGDELRESQDLYDDIRKLMRKYKGVADQLSFLDGQVGYMTNSSELEAITLADIKQYSGMPDLMEYIAYIAKTKARDELANSVAYQIDIQQTKIQGIVNRIENLRKLMEKDDECIKEIKAIIDDFRSEKTVILSSELKREEIDKYSAMRAYQEDAEKQGDEFGFGTIREIEEGKIEKNYRAYQGSNSIEDLFFRCVKAKAWKEFESQKRQKILYEADEWIQHALQESMKEVRGQIWEKESSGLKSLEKLNEVCANILNDRIEELGECIEEYKSRLKKYECEYMMPKIPSFSYDYSKERKGQDLKMLKSDNIDKVAERLGGLYKKSNGFRRLWENIKWTAKGEKEVWGMEKRKARKLDKEGFDHILEGAYKDIIDAARESHLTDCVMEDKGVLVGRAVKHIDGVRSHFRETNKDLNHNIDLFIQSIDDREKYKEDIQKLEEEEKLIHDIEAGTKEFIAFWNEIANPVNPTAAKA